MQIIENQGQRPSWDDVASPQKLEPKTTLALPYLFCHIHLSVKDMGDHLSSLNPLKCLLLADVSY